MSEASKENDTWLVYSDGASRGNPGLASIGAVVIDPQGKVRQEVSEALGVTTNNVAEYRALIAGLEGALALGARRVEVRMDSELIVRQALGRYKVKSPGLIPYFQRAMDLRRKFETVNFVHVRRELNKHADALANEALDREAPLMSNKPITTGMISAIVLAAGESTRMGRLKQLLPWDGTTLLDWQVREAHKAGIDDVLIVLGHAMEEIRDSLLASATDARMVINEAYQEGRAASMRRGAETVDDSVAAVVILSVDQPRPAWATRLLIDRWRDTGASIVLPVYDGHRGHPVLLTGKLIPELRKVVDRDFGLRAVVERHADEVITVEAGNAAVDVNLNTPEDYERALAAFERGEWEREKA